MNPIWTETQIDMLRKLWTDGMTYAGMVPLIGKSLSSISKKRMYLKLPVRRSGPMASRPKTLPNSQRFNGVYVPFVRKAIQHPEMNPVPLEMTVMGKGCRFSISEQSPHFFCNNEGHPYCDVHRKVVYQP
jgi:hypothetical protein